MPDFHNSVPKEIIEVLVMACLPFIEKFFTLPEEASFQFPFQWHGSH